MLRLLHRDGVGVVRRGQLGAGRADVLGCLLMRFQRLADAAERGQASAAEQTHASDRAADAGHQRRQAHREHAE